MDIDHVMRVLCYRLFLCLYLWIIDDVGLRHDVMTADVNDQEVTVAYKYLDSK